MRKSKPYRKESHHEQHHTGITPYIPLTAQLKACKDLRWPIADKLFDLHALAAASLAILDRSEARGTCEQIEIATRLLSQLENETREFVEEVDTMFASVRRRSSWLKLLKRQTMPT